MKTILITGAAGFIGSSLADELLGRGLRVVAFDNFNNYYDPAQKRENISAAAESPNYKLYAGDIENPHDLQRVFAENKIDSVVHLGARAGVRPSLEDPISYVNTNIIGTMNVLEAMRAADVKKMVFASSSSVYGNCTADKFTEDIDVREPISPYAMTKSAGEQLCYTYHALYGMSVVALRFFTVYGPRQRPDLAIRKFAQKIRRDEAIEMFGDGSNMRDYTYIGDILSGIIAAMDYDKAPFEIVNLAGGRPITLRDMIFEIENAMGKKAEIKQMPMQPGDVDKTIGDITKAARLFGYAPKTSFADGVKKTIEWLDTKG
ncbi:MAG: SDR family NAD(P)-dependent oxidoreductase [Alphaproteobacteria bacterium]|nr:SDR family NAD(P)-dependent oxidoreductase [Alphaproteobacteria bacterium]MCL2757945.1 SDR family NAD(P)-dependent oxidoreductase [Alphaproteobacteria bacterium]